VLTGRYIGRQTAERVTETTGLTVSGLVSDAVAISGSRPQFLRGRVPVIFGDRVIQSHRLLPRISFSLTSDSCQLRERPIQNSIWLQLDQEIRTDTCT